VAQRLTENDIGTIVTDLAIAVHQELAQPGLFETFYEGYSGQRVAR
jgi:hypothetical protein